MTSLCRIAVLTVLVCASLARAESFTLFIHESPAQLALRDDPGARGKAYWAAYAAVAQAMTSAGVLRGGTALRVGGSPARVRASSTSPGTREALPLGGFFTVEVASEAEALDWARRIPAASTGGEVVVRAAVASPSM